MKKRIVGLSLVCVVACHSVGCDPGAPPRSQADTRVHGSSAIGIVEKPQGASTHIDPRHHTSAALFDPDRACETHADCAIIPDDCRECPPCDAVWRSAANYAAVRRIVEARAAVECPPIYCEQCWTPPPPGAAPAPHGYLGDAAECRAGQCVVTGQ